MASKILRVALGLGAAAARADDVTINALQWNPHWECFARSGDCRAQALSAISERLSDGTDFANIIELEAAYTPPAGWGSTAAQCGLDSTRLFFNAARWRAAEGPGAQKRGCMMPGDRAYVVQAFESYAGDARVVVVGAHFPHGGVGIWAPLGESIRNVVAATGIENVLVIADTNIQSPYAFLKNPVSMTSEELMWHIGVNCSQGGVQATDLVESCCFNPPAKFSWDFDRIMANFGTAMTTHLYDDPPPYWAVGAFHKAVRGRLTVPKPTPPPKPAPPPEPTAPPEPTQPPEPTAPPEPTPSPTPAPHHHPQAHAPRNTSKKGAASLKIAPRNTSNKGTASLKIAPRNASNKGTASAKAAPGNTSKKGTALVKMELLL